METIWTPDPICFPVKEVPAGPFQADAPGHRRTGDDAAARGRRAAGTAAGGTNHLAGPRRGAGEGRSAD